MGKRWKRRNRHGGKSQEKNGKWSWGNVIVCQGKKARRCTCPDSMGVGRGKELEGKKRGGPARPFFTTYLLGSEALIDLWDRGKKEIVVMSVWGKEEVMSRG